MCSFSSLGLEDERNASSYAFDGSFFVWIIHSYLIRDTNKKMLKTLYFVWSSGSPLFYLFNLILSERACHGSDEWDSTRSAYRVSLRKNGIFSFKNPLKWILRGWNTKKLFFNPTKIFLVKTRCNLTTLWPSSSLTLRYHVFCNFFYYPS